MIFLDAVTHALSGPFCHVIITKTNWCADSPFPSVYWPYSLLHLFVGLLRMFFRFLLRHIFRIHVAVEGGIILQAIVQSLLALLYGKLHWYVCDRRRIQHK